MVTDFIVLTQSNSELIALRADKINNFKRDGEFTFVDYDCEHEYIGVIESVEEIIKLIDNCK